MTTAELRTVALTVKQRIQAMHADISPAYNEVETWELDNIDDNLPTVGEVKAALLAYEAFEKPSLLLYEEVRTLKMTADNAAALPDIAEFAPFEHQHVTGDISNFPATMIVQELLWAGDGSANRVIAIPFAFSTADIYSTPFRGRGWSNGYCMRDNGDVLTGIWSISGGSLTLLNTLLNQSNANYSVVIRGVL